MLKMRTVISDDTSTADLFINCELAFPTQNGLHAPVSMFGRIAVAHSSRVNKIGHSKRKWPVRESDLTTDAARRTASRKSVLAAARWTG
jgi:hypothetical protein